MKTLAGPLFTSDSTKFLMGLGESVLKLTLILVFFSYVSIRTHYNYLGISSLVIPNINNYLAEFWQLFSGTVLVLVQIGVLLMVVALPAYWLASRFLKRWSSDWYFTYTPHLLFYALILWYGFLSLYFTSEWSQWDVLVGELRWENLNTESDGELFYYVQTVVVFGVILLIDWGRQRPQWKVYSTTWNLSLAMLVFLVINLPLWHGRFIKKPSYPSVSIITHEKRYCGFLIEDVADDYTLWSSTGNRGIVMKIPKSAAVQVETGKVYNLMEAARNGLRSPANTRTPCIDL